MDTLLSYEVQQELKSLARQCMDEPSLLYDPKLSFIKELIEFFGGKIPLTKANGSSDEKCEFQSKPEEPEQPESEPESEESDLELDMSGVIG